MSIGRRLGPRDVGDLAARQDECDRAGRGGGAEVDLGPEAALGAVKSLALPPPFFPTARVGC